MSMWTRPTRRRAAIALALTAGVMLVPACGSDGPSGGSTSTTCVSGSDSGLSGDAGASDTTLVGRNSESPTPAGGVTGASGGSGGGGSNSAAGDAPGPAPGGGVDNAAVDGGSSTGNADTGSGGSSRSC